MQGFNMGRYVPPDLEGKTTGNKIHGKKPPGIHGDKQTVRFEMPFNIFCNCEGHIAQGTRFNAEKKKIGNYYSTPIFSFRMKHSTCGGWVEIHTDPKNTAYVVAEGAKKKSADEDKEAGFIRILDPAEKPVEDPFAKKEKNVVDKTEAKVGAARIAELQELSDRQWSDPYEHSKKIRKGFRAERKLLASKALANEALADRAGLHIELLDAAPEDIERAKLIEFSTDYERDIAQAQTRPLFQKAEQAAKTLRITPRTRNRDIPDLTKKSLKQDLQRNTRAAIDPFLNPDWSQPNRARNLKRKDREQVPEMPELAKLCATRNTVSVEASPERQTKTVSKSPRPSLGLDDYSSDDD